MHTHTHTHTHTQKRVHGHVHVSNSRLLVDTESPSRPSRQIDRKGANRIESATGRSSREVAERRRRILAEIPRWLAIPGSLVRSRAERSSRRPKRGFFGIRYSTRSFAIYNPPGGKAAPRRLAREMRRGDGPRGMKYATAREVRGKLSSLCLFSLPRPITSRCPASPFSRVARVFRRRGEEGALAPPNKRRKFHGRPARENRTSSREKEREKERKLRGRHGCLLAAACRQWLYLGGKASGRMQES